MIHISQAIVVEGKYDKNAIKQLVDAPVFTTDGFGVMNDRKLLSLLRTVAQKRGLIVLTDSDGAGFVIRSYLKGALPKDRVLHAYIPDVFGKEKRKKSAGKEGKLGVEGMTPEVLLQCLQNAGAGTDESGTAKTPIREADFYALGLSGGTQSAQKRGALKRRLDLPEHLSSRGLLEMVNILFDREEFISMLQEEPL
jgi:ribonuclease M5